MKPTADIIRVLLMDNGWGGDVNESWPVFVGFMPDAPDSAICVYDTAGTVEGRIMRTGEKITHPGVQVHVRGADYWTARNKIEEIAEGLDRCGGSAVILTEDSASPVYDIQNVSRTGDIQALGQDESDQRRFHFTLNAVTTIKERE